MADHGRVSARVVAARRRAAVVVAGIVLSAVVGVRGLLAAQPPAPPHVHVVRSGETLWEVARMHSADDPRSYIHTLRSLNGLSSAQIFPGQSLILPG